MTPTIRAALLHAAAVAMAALALGGSALAGEGVVVTRVEPGLAADTAGLQAGDVLTAWEQGEASGLLRSPFDLAEAELEFGPRGPVRVRGVRGGGPLAASLFPDAWGIEASPQGEDEAWRRFEAAKAAVAKRQMDAAASAIGEAVRGAAAAGRPTAEAQLLTFLGESLRDAERFEEAAAAYERALEARRRAGSGPLAVAWLADPIQRAGVAPRDRCLKLLREAVAAYERLAPGSRGMARVLDGLGWLVGGEEQKALANRALALAERVAPDSPLLAQALFSVAWNEPERAVELLARALAIQERREPEGRQTGLTMSFLGRHLDYAGEVKRAREHEERAERLLAKVAPGSGEHGHAVNNLGLYWRERGDLVQAERLYRRALEIEERRAPAGFGVARSHYNLGLVLVDRRDYVEAETHLARARAMSEAHGYGKGMAARALYTIGRIRLERGDAAAAEPMLREALEVVGRVDRHQVGNARQHLADALDALGRAGEAEALYRENIEEALRLRVRYALGERHHALAAHALRRGDLETAERHHRAALELRRVEVPDTLYHAESSHGLGTVRRRRGSKDEALALFREAVAAIEGQSRVLGGTEEDRAAFRAHYQRYYRDLEDLLLEMGRAAEAFQTLERSRSRGLLAMLATRDIGLEGRLPPELEVERRRAESEYQRVHGEWSARGLDDGGWERLRVERQAARRRLDDVRARVRAAAPRVAALRDPEPLDLAAVRRVLEPGTVLLAYSLGTPRGRLYAVGPGPGDFAVHPLPEAEDGVRAAVLAFREAIAAQRSGVLRGAVAGRALALTRMLLAPAARGIARARNVLVVPDGPLYLLPFAALRDPSATARHLVEAKPVHVVSSMSVYAVLDRRWSDAPAERAVIGFGDPAYGKAGTPAPGEAPAVTRARRAGLRLDALPATRREVEALRSLSPAAQVWLGDEATEERALRLGPGARVIHFACHGFLDPHLPLESGLALTLPRDSGAGGENGLLQAWEVFERLRVDADLVTLSACDSGLGAEMAGEGLLGLTWAFQYAGARSVLASLWEVSDESTADLMKAFYGHLAAGVPKPEALRRAQAGLLRSPRTRAPYYWAGFTLVGAGR